MKTRSGENKTSENNVIFILYNGKGRLEFKHMHTHYFKLTDIFLDARDIKCIEISALLYDWTGLVVLLETRPLFMIFHRGVLLYLFCFASPVVSI